MRISWGWVGLGACLAVIGIWGCKGSVTTGGAAGSSGSGGGPGGDETSGGCGMSGSGRPGACEPADPACSQVRSDCIALADNRGKSTFALRVAQMEVTAPAAFTKPLLKSMFDNSSLMNLDQCQLRGTGSLSLVLRFDTASGTLELGGAHPAQDPWQGYTFVNEVFGSFTIAPISMPLTIGACGQFSAAGDPDLVLPVYFQATDKEPMLLLPLHHVSIEGSLTADHNCIGHYNADVLDPNAGCQPFDMFQAFTSAADLGGTVGLEEADAYVIGAFEQSLCVLLSGDALMYGDGGFPIKCKRDANNQIVFQGDRCAATNQPADASCHDAVAIAAKLAASAVLVKP